MNQIVPLAKYDAKKKGPHLMITLTLVKPPMNKINLLPNQIVGFQPSDDAAKPGVTVVYTTFQAYPFEVKEDVQYISNMLNNTRFGLQFRKD